MRQIQTLTTRQIASALVKAEDSVPVNEAPNPYRVDIVTDRLDRISADHGLNPQELRGDQAAVVQDIYVSNREDGLYVDSAFVR